MYLMVTITAGHGHRYVHTWQSVLYIGGRIIVDDMYVFAYINVVTVTKLFSMMWHIRT